jgi:hypothetical protein
VNKVIRSVILTLLVVIVSQAQQETESPRANRYAASVRKLKGSCVVRDSQAAKPRKLKSDEKLHAGQQLQCEAKSSLTIQFRTSGTDKEIKAVDPNWYVIPNVPERPPKLAPISPAGRPKATPRPKPRYPKGEKPNE